ncbi:MAG: helix-turn-helix transcriptional regulator [Desulfovibrionaceae bacterium]|jgi:DNA-binding HxlR family transcriptional regulator|nr:helix-turn-helix transcriptional regulator [Desulfovibrionaceae bacterium]
MPDVCPQKVLGNRIYFCTVELALQVIGGKWKPIILFHLATGGTQRFSELKRSVPSITQKMLTQQLRELEADDMVHREVFPQVPPRVEYSLTDLGRSVMPVLRELQLWGAKFEQQLGGAQAVAEKDSAGKRGNAATSPASVNSAAPDADDAEEAGPRTREAVA